MTYHALITIAMLCVVFGGLSAIVLFFSETKKGKMRHVYEGVAVIALCVTIGAGIAGTYLAHKRNQHYFGNLATLPNGTYRIGVHTPLPGDGTGVYREDYCVWRTLPKNRVGTCQRVTTGVPLPQQFTMKNGQIVK